MENLKLIMSKAFFINANMCCVRRAGTELSADQLVLRIFKVTDGITPPSPPPPTPLYNLVFSPTYLHPTCINFLNTFLSVPLSCAAEAPTYLHPTCINFLNTFLSVPLSCAAEARNTLPAAFSLVEKATGPGSRIMQASLTRREYDC